MSGETEQPLRVADPPASKPVMIFDGDCNFCRRWIARWKRISVERIDYVAARQVATRFPEIDADAYLGRVHLVSPDGSVRTGADAVVAALAENIPVRAWLYRRLPGVRPVARLVYEGVARNRRLASFLAQLCWGASPAPSTYHVTRWLFLRGLGIIYLVAFVSLWLQIEGLLGSRGILPVAEFTGALAEKMGPERFRMLPTLFWLGSGDGMLHLVCGVGVVSSLLLIVGVCPPLCLALLWGLYLSLVTVGRIFLGYQWDSLLLETGFLAIFFAPWQILPKPAREAPPSRLFHFLLCWLLFRLMLGSGLVKFSSWDEAWWPKLTALTYHYETQPLPTWTAWFAHQLPLSVHRLSCAMTLLLELVLPLLIFTPRRLRVLSCMGLVSLQLVIIGTGNYTFFNWLTIALCLLLLDDAVFPARWADRFRVSTLRTVPRWRSTLHHTTAWPVAAVLFPLSLLIFWGQVAGFMGRFGARPQEAEWPEPVARVQWALGPFRVVNSYGLFAAMTKTRPEIIVQGSLDGRTWRDYAFKYKPGDLARRPRFVAPHQPRLDWQMWFAALGDIRNPRTQNWFLPFMVRLLEGSPPVLGLLEENPFPGQPPLHMRAIMYDYTFTDRATRNETENWWQRAEPPRLFCPPLSVQFEEPKDPE